MLWPRRKSPLIRYIITGGYVGVATVGAFIATYQSMGIPLKLLRTWGQCSNWGTDAVAGFSNACDAFDAFASQMTQDLVALDASATMSIHLHHTAQCRDRFYV